MQGESLGAQAQLGPIMDPDAQDSVLDSLQSGDYAFKSAMKQHRKGGFKVANDASQGALNKLKELKKFTKQQ